MDFFESSSAAPDPIDFPSSPVHRFDIVKPDSPLIYSNYLWLYPDEIPSMELNAELPVVKIPLNDRSSEKLDTKSDSANDFTDNLKISTNFVSEDNAQDILSDLLPEPVLKPALTIDIPPSPMDMLPHAATESPLYRGRNASTISIATNISQILNNEYLRSLENTPISSVLAFDEITCISPNYKQFLVEIVSEKSYLVPDKFWPTVLSTDFPFPVTEDESYQLWCAQHHLKIQFVTNCPVNGNLYSLLNHLVVRLLAKSALNNELLNALGLFNFLVHMLIDIDWEMARYCFVPANKDSSPIKEKNELDNLFDLLVNVDTSDTLVYNQTCLLLLQFASNEQLKLKIPISIDLLNQLLSNAITFQSVTTGGLFGFFSNGTTVVTDSNVLSLELFLIFIYQHLQLLKKLQLDFNLIYTSMQHIQECPLLCNLLFLVLVHCPEFHGFLMSKSDPESFILPILHVLYNNLHRPTSAKTLYVPLMLLFIITSDDLFANQLNHINITTPEWFLVKLGNTSLINILHTSCSLLLIYNASGLKDEYIQGTALIILYQLTANIRQMHPYTAQKFVNVFSSFYKKFLKEFDPTVRNIINGCIEILNVGLGTNIKQNTHLVYCLIHQQNMITSINGNDEFDDLNEIYKVAHLLDDHAEQFNDPQELYELVNKEMRTFVAPTVEKKKFKYHVEDEFQIPFIWEEVKRFPLMHW